MEIQFRLVLDPHLKAFVLTLGDNPLFRMHTPMGGSKKGGITKRWVLTALETEEMIKKARNQLLDATDAMTEFTLEIKDFKINLTGIVSKTAFQGIVEYLEKVWNSFRGSNYYGQVYPQ